MFAVLSFLRRIIPLHFLSQTDIDIPLQEVCTSIRLYLSHLCQLPLSHVTMMATDISRYYHSDNVTVSKNYCENEITPTAYVLLKSEK